MKEWGYAWDNGGPLNLEAASLAFEIIAKDLIPNLEEANIKQAPVDHNTYGFYVRTSE